MKQYKILTAAVVAAVLGGSSAMAQFTYNPNDMFAAFGNGGSTDVIVDLGSISSFQNGSAAGSINLSSVISDTFGGVSGSVYWAVFGGNDASSTVWNTLKRNNTSNKTTSPFVGGSAESQALVVGDIASIGSFTSPGLAGSGLITDYAAGIEQVATSVGLFTPMMTGAYSGNFQGDWTYNILNNGVGTSDLYESAPGNHFVNHAAYLGNFSLSSGGVLTFAPVPEPSTYAMLGSGALAFLALRRRK
jgi:hypothetical protein